MLRLLLWDFRREVIYAVFILCEYSSSFLECDYKLGVVTKIL